MKKAFSMYLMLLTLMLGSLSTAASSASPSPWASDAVSKLKGLGALEASWYTDYQKPLTRREFACLAVLTLETLSGEPTEGISDELNATFTDTKDYYVLQAWQQGIVSGDGSGRFNPEGTLTREALAVMLSRAAEKAGKPVASGTVKPGRFKDMASVSPWAKASLEAFISAGILNGDPQGNLNPQASVTREQAYKILVALLETKNSLYP